MNRPQEFLDVAEAQQLVLAGIRAADTIELDLRDALGYTLAREIRADIDDPPFDRALMDGYAVRSTDLNEGCELRVIGQITAGATFAGTVLPGQAVQINTGATLPAGADAVVPVEQTELLPGGQIVKIRAAAAAGMNVTPRGRHVRAGDIVVPSHTRLGAPQIAVAAAMGAARVTVYRPADVAVLSTGDELVDIDRVPGAGQIRNSNGYLLEMLCRQCGAQPVSLGIARDEAGDLEKHIRRGMEHEILLITGGISMGVLDLVPHVLQRCGVQFSFRKMAIRPGRPTLFGTLEPNGARSGGRCAIFALPGNPVSAFVSFWLLVRPALAAREQRVAVLQPSIAARLDGELKPVAERRSYFPARLAPGSDGQLSVRPTRWYGSGDPFGLVSANALIVRPPRAPAAAPGTTVDVLMLEPL